MVNEAHLRVLRRGIEAWNQWRGKHPEIHPDLSGANLSGLDLSGAQFHNTDLSDCNLAGAFLRDTDLRNACLNGANLRVAYLLGANLTGADLSAVNLDHATSSGNILVNVDLREVQELNAIRHLGPSELSISTVYRSEGKIPKAFLRGCGVPESFIKQLSTLAASMQPVQFHSCFISYSSKDHKFVERLYSDLLKRGVPCWYAPNDLGTGERIRVSLDESIQNHDKLLVILSENSIESEWVEKEVETAMERERQQKHTVLLPIRLDDSILDVASGWPADVRRSRNVGDFRQWKSNINYNKAFEKLLRDLKVEP